MTKQQFWKGMFMLIISVLITGLSQTPINYALLGIAAVAAVLPYVGKNLILVLNSTSPSNDFNFLNIVSVVLIGAGAGLTDAVGQHLFEGVILWPMVWKVVIYATGTYFLATFFAPPNATSPKLFAK
jgi:predicted membrane channel-forming protein YqfA (hemolysin III family)